MRTDAYTFPAVYTAVGVYFRLAVMNSDSLGGTALKARGTALALFNVKLYGMSVIGFIHSRPSPNKLSDIYSHCYFGSDADDGLDVHLIRIAFHVGKSHSRAEA